MSGSLRSKKEAVLEIVACICVLLGVISLLWSILSFSSRNEKIVRAVSVPIPFNAHNGDAYIFYNWCRCYFMADGIGRYLCETKEDAYNLLQYAIAVRKGLVASTELPASIRCKKVKDEELFVYPRHHDVKLPSNYQILSAYRYTEMKESSFLGVKGTRFGKQYWIINVQVVPRFDEKGRLMR